MKDYSISDSFQPPSPSTAISSCPRFLHYLASHSPLQITPHKNIARLLASGTCSFSPPFPMQMSTTANKPKGQEKLNGRSYLLMVFFVSFVEKRTYPWQHPLQSYSWVFGEDLFWLGFFFKFLLPPPPPLTVNKIYVKCPQEQNKTEEVQTRKKRRKEEGKSKALQLGIQQALSFEGFF